jgi:F0F1-type ATP synthase epsilon subunit
MSSESLTLKIITPQGPIIEEESLSAVNVPLVNHFPIGIRPGHAPLIAETAKGFIRYRTSDRENEIELYSGILKIRKNIVTILTSGEVTNNGQELTPPENIEYDRLMVTLIDQSIDKQEEL